MGKIIIFADDNGTSRLMFKCMVPQHLPGYQIETYENGKTLQNKLEQGNNGISAVVTDNAMPEIHGSEVIKEYAKKEGFENIPFILVYCGDPQIGEQAKQNGAYDYCMKPLEYSEFCEVLKKAIQEKSNQ